MPEPRAMTAEELAAIRRSYERYPGGASSPDLDNVRALLAHLAALEREVAEARADLLFIRDEWSVYGARACRACVYDKGRFIRLCKVHEYADEQTKRAEEAERQRDALRAVAAYGRHKSSCAGGMSYAPGLCDCGFRKAADALSIFWPGWRDA